MHVGLGEVLDQALEVGHPGGLEVRVLEQQPGAVLGELFEHGGGLLALALAQRQLLQVFAHFFVRKFLQIRKRV